MNTQAATDNGMTNVSVILDKESLKIIQEASEVYAHTIVNMGIKLFAKTNAYKEFMKYQDFKDLDTSTEDLAGIVDIAAAASTPQPQTGVQTPNAGNSGSVGGPTAPKASAGGFTSW